MAEIDVTTARGQLLNLLRVFDPDPADAQRTYAELALRCQTRLWGGPPGAVHLPPGQGKPPGKPPPAAGVTEADEIAAIRAALGFFGAEPDDARKGNEELVARLAVILDTIVGRWTSALVQPVGPSGDMPVPAPGG